MKKNKTLCLIVLVAIAILTLLYSCEPKIKHGFVVENGKTYYYLNGEMQLGWQKIDGEYYYFGTGGDVPSDQIGAMCKNYLVGEWDGPTYGLGRDGKMLKEQFAIIDNRRLYFGSDGAMITNTQKEINGKIYIFDEVGNSKEGPYYSAPAPMGGTYNFYLEKDLPWDIYFSDTKWWTIEKDLKLDVVGNNLFISGIVKKQTSENYSIGVQCILSMTNKDGITTSTGGYTKPDMVAKGEKTYLNITIKGLPNGGGDIYLSFTY